MKLLFITQNIAPFRMNWIEEMAKYIEVEVVHLNEYDATCNKKYIEGIKGKVKISDESKIVFGKRLFKTKNIVNRKYDLLMLDGYGFLGQLILIIYLRMKRKKFIMTIDGGIVTEGENIIKRSIKKYCLKSPFAILSTSQNTDSFIKHYTGDTVRIYRHLFSSIYQKDIIDFNDRKKLHDLYKNELGFQDKKVVLCVGRFIQLKRFDLIIKCSEFVNDTYKFVFIGGKPNDDYLNLINDRNRNKLQFIDFLYYEELKKYYIAADVFCHPTESDVWGLVIGEAMAMGLPILSSDGCKAALEMVKDDNGIIVDEASPEAYALALKKLESNPEKMINMQKNNIDLMHKYAIDSATKTDISNLLKIKKLLNKEV